MNSNIYTLLGVVITAITTYGVTVKASKKEKEDINVARTGQAIETWKELAESNKDHWDECEVKCSALEEKCEKMQGQIDTQHQAILDLKTELHTLKQQVHGKLALDAEHNQSNH
jgi:chromosome segregation ATPase